MKVVHLTVVRQLSQGQIKQLRFEYAASLKAGALEWATIAYHDGESTEPFVRQLPFIFRWLFLRSLYGWYVAWRLSKTCDRVLMRHMTFDPFALIFSPFVRGRVSVHHAKEVEELRLIRKGWKGWAASKLESITGRVAAINAVALVGVTKEIAEYERCTRAPDKPIGVYPNGIDPNQVLILKDHRSGDSIQVAFICGTFSAWHGLDKLLAAVDSYDFFEREVPLTIHLIGRLSAVQLGAVSSSDARKKIFKVHGSMTESEYRPILEKCDFGIASLAMERQNLREGSTLKVREMLAMGLAIYSGHEDIALVQDKKFIAVVDDVSVESLIAFGKLVKHVERECVRAESLGLIDKHDLMVALRDRLVEIG